LSSSQGIIKKKLDLVSLNEDSWKEIITESARDSSFFYEKQMKIVS